MRKLFWQISVTLNGFMEGPNGELNGSSTFEWVERTGLMGAVRPQTPHRSPRQAFGGNLE